MEEKELHQKSYRRVIEYIKEQIRSGNLAMGSKLPTERDLSSILGISRSSVREAMRTLDIMGIISSQQGSGNYLTGNFQYNLVETIYMMLLLDQIDYKQISQLRRFLDKKVYFSIAKASNNKLIIDILQALSDVIDELDMQDLQETSLKRNECTPRESPVLNT